MEQEYTEAIRAVQNYRLPRYHEIPNVGLYLNQVTKYINDYLALFPDMAITESMISNYVKKRLVANPRKKQYDREQIAYLIVIDVAKSVLPLDYVKRLLAIQQKTYPCDVAYDYFCCEFENVLQFVFGCKAEMEEIGQDSNDTKMLFRRVIVTVAHKIYLEYSFRNLKDE